MTEFGRALLVDGLGHATSFVDAFELAVQRVTKLEEELELEYSEPQIHRQPEVEKQLREWRQQR